MATIKIKFRPSTVDGKPGTIFYQVTHNRVTRQKKTSYRLYGYEWDARLSEIVFTQSNENRKGYLLEINDKIKEDIKKFYRITENLLLRKCTYTANDIIAEFIREKPQSNLFPFMKDVILKLKSVGKIRTSETYESSLLSFMKFRNNVDLSLEDIDSEVIMAYEAYLRKRGICLNSSSFYMRNLRAVYNRAVDKELTPQRYPFKHVYTGVERTIKRAVPLKIIKKIKLMNFEDTPTFDFARDMFLFSFYTRGMSFVDMAYLRKCDLSNGILQYCRRKTGQQMYIKWEKCMQEIIDKYNCSNSKYLLPIIKPLCNIDERKQYIYMAHNINRSLKIIGAQLHLSVPLTLYVARHAWASIARSKKVPLSVISEGMGHDSERTTQIYLASLDTIAIDKANSMILNLL